MIRFWRIPENNSEKIWTELKNAQVDFIDTNDLKRFYQYNKL
jgi:hypothetical protein